MNYSFKVIEKVIEFIFPYVCPICKDVVSYNSGFCKSCFSKIKFIEEDYNIYDNLKFNEFLDNIFSLCYYNDFIKDSLIKSKTYNNFDDRYTQNSYIYINMFLNKFSNCNFIKNCDIITFVPSFKEVKNHSYFLASNLSNNVGVKLVNTVKKIKNTKKQHLLYTGDRYKNVKDSFLIDEFNVKNKDIIIVDDIITTGASVNEIAKILKLNGANKVFAVSICVTKYCGG